MNTIPEWGRFLCCAHLTAKSSEKMCVKVREGQFSRAHQNPEISFHKGLLVDLRYRKNLSMVLLVSRDLENFRQIIELYMSRDTRRPMERFFPSRVIKSLQGPCN